MHASSIALMLLALMPMSALAQGVYRCGNQYSDQPCQGAKVVNVAPAVRDLNHAGTRTVFSCVAPQGARFWSSAHCRESGALVERMESVPANLSWEEQLHRADQQTKRGYAIQHKAMHAPAAAPAQHTVKPDCSHFNEQVARYDALARQPQGAGSQDWIAQRRREVRDAQFRAGC